MATLKIWETVRVPGEHTAIRLDERVTFQQVAFTTTAGQSAAFDEDTGTISVKADVACAVAVGSSPAASANSFPVAANILTDFTVEPGQRLSVVAVA